ncbi:MAG: type II secretion system protein GspK, partial [Brevundimonas sp.]
MRPGSDNREGMALLTVLLLVAVMSVVAVAVLDDVRFSVRRATNAETQAQAQWYASGAEALARRQVARLLAAGPTVAETLAALAPGVEPTTGLAAIRAS